MEYLPQGNRAALGEHVEDQILATGKHVVVIGGGDTGADCIGTAHRQGAASVTSLEIMPQPGEDRPSTQPWPTYPMLYRVASAHEEGGERIYAVSTTEFVGDDDGNVAGLRLTEVELVDGKLSAKPGTEREIPAQLVLFAMGFLGPEGPGVVEQLGVEPRRAQQRQARQDLHELGARCLRGRRRRSRAVAHRLGHRRGPRGGGRRRRLADRLERPAAADRTDRPTAHGLISARISVIRRPNPR